MKKILTRIVQFVLFPALGLFIIWQLYKEQKVNDILEILKNDLNYSWIWLSAILAVFSHLSRAMRWQMLIESVEKKTRLSNTFWAVMTGYLANYALPRLGEISRCGVLSKYEKISFTRVIGTVVAERLIDLLMLLLIVITVLAIQFDFLKDLIFTTLNIQDVATLLKSPFPYILLGLLAIAVWILKRNIHKLSIFKQLKSLVSKFMEGLVSIRKVKNKPLFIFHTLFIWTMYFLMIYVCFFSMKETSHLTLGAGITILFTGSLGMLAPVQGGIGPWHFMVIATLKLYGVPADSASIFALVAHTAQTGMIIVTGILAFIILPIINKSTNEANTKETVQLS